VLWKNGLVKEQPDKNNDPYSARLLPESIGATTQFSRDRDNMGEGRLRFRHGERVNSVRADGSVALLRKDEVQYRHIYPTAE